MTTPGVITIQEPHTGGKTLLQLLHKIGWVIDDNLKKKIKNQTSYTCRLFLLTPIFQYIGQKYLSIGTNLFSSNYTYSNSFSTFF